MQSISNDDNMHINDVITNHNKHKDEWNDNDLDWIRDIQNNDYKSLKVNYGTNEAIHVLIETQCLIH